MRNTAFLLSAMQTVTSSTNYAINQMITAESPEDWIFRFPPESETSLPEVHVGSCGVCTSRDDSLDGDPRPGGARTPWMDTVRRYVRRFRVSHARDRPLARDAATCSGSAYLPRDAFSLRGFTRAFQPYPHRTCPVAVSAHPKAPIPIRRREDIPDGKSGSRGPKGPKVGARGGAPKGPRKNRSMGSENQSAMIGRRGRRAPPSVSKTPVKTTNVVDEPVDDAKRALVGALAAVALAAAPVADAMTEGGLIGNVDVAQLFELAGFGAPTGALDSPPLPEQQLKQILDLDERAALRKASLIRTGNYDVLLQVSLILLNKS